MLAMLCALLTLAPPTAADIAGDWLFRAEGLEVRFVATADGRFARTVRTAQGVEESEGEWKLEGETLSVISDGATTRFRCRLTDAGELEIVGEDGAGIRMVRQKAAGGEAPAAPPPPANQGALTTAFPLPASASGHIAFTRAVPTRFIAGGFDETIPLPKLFVMPGAGGEATPLIFGEATTVAKEARWTWDGRGLAFSSDFHSERSALVHDNWIASTAGGPARRITGNELVGPAPAGYGAVTGMIQDNTKSQQWAIDRAASTINITAQGAGIIVHPGELTDIEVIDTNTKEKLRDEPMRRFYIPRVAAGDQVWVKVWCSSNMGHLLFCQVRAGEVTDLGNVQINECNYAASKPNVTPDGRWCVGMGHILSVDPNARPGEGAAPGVIGGTESVSVVDLATGALVASIDGMRMGALSCKDPALGPDGRSLACAVGEPTLEGLGILDLEAIVAGNPRPRVIAQGGRIFPTEATLFRTANISCVSPAWSPDGQLLAFCRFSLGEDVQGDLCVVPAGGGEPRQITRVAANQVATQPSFSPDGQRIAYTLVTGLGPTLKVEQLLLCQFRADIWSVNVDGSDPRRLTDDGLSSEPAWGP